LKDETPEGKILKLGLSALIKENSGQAKTISVFNFIRYSKGGIETCKPIVTNYFLDN
jgi:hypothetical protein